MSTTDRVEAFYTWAEADDSETRTIFLCAIDSIVKNPADFESFWVSISGNIEKHPTLKRHMDEFVKCSIDGGNDSWL